MVNFEWYRTFAAIYKTGTLTEASKELFISQPNVSQHLSNLESYLGQKLFDRTNRKISPTEYGKQLYSKIISSVEMLEQVEATFKKSNLSKQPNIYIGSPVEFFSARIVGNLHKLEGNIHTRFGLTSELIENLEKGDLHFVIATQQIEKKNIVYEPVLEEKLLLTGNATLLTEEFDELIVQKKIDQAEKWLAQQNWIAYSYNMALIKRFWQINFNKRPNLNLRMIVPDLNVIAKVLETQQMISIIPHYLIKNQMRNNTVKEIWQGIKPTTNTLYLAYTKGKVTQTMIEMVKALIV